MPCNGFGQRDHMDLATYPDSRPSLAERGAKCNAPLKWMLVTLQDSEIMPSAYAKKATAAGIDLITWTLECSGPLDSGNGWYDQSIKDVTDNDPVACKVSDVLAQNLKIKGVSYDWPAAVTFTQTAWSFETRPPPFVPIQKDRPIGGGLFALQPQDVFKTFNDLRIRRVHPILTS